MGRKISLGKLVSGVGQLFNTSLFKSFESNPVSTARTQVSLEGAYKTKKDKKGNKEIWAYLGPTNWLLKVSDHQP